MTTTKEMIAVMEAFEAGKPIECMSYDYGIWRPCDNPSWDWSAYAYRVALTKPTGDWHSLDYRVALTKPSWDWSHVSDEINFLVRDSDGEVMGLTSRPYPDNRWWRFGGGVVIAAKYIASYEPGTCDWRDSLVVRPGYKEKDQ